MSMRESGRGVRKSSNLCDVIYEWSPIQRCGKFKVLKVIIDFVPGQWHSKNDWDLQQVYELQWKLYMGYWPGKNNIKFEFTF